MPPMPATPPVHRRLAAKLLPMGPRCERYRHRSALTGFPCHTTVRTGPYTAVRMVYGMMGPSVEAPPAAWFRSVRATWMLRPVRWLSGLHPSLHRSVLCLAQFLLSLGIHGPSRLLPHPSVRAFVPYCYGSTMPSADFCATFDCLTTTSVAPSFDAQHRADLPR